MKNFSVDHKQPVSRGGSCDLGNLEIVSARANSIKGNLARDEFCELLDLTRKWPKEAHSDIMGRLRAATNSRHRIFFKKKV